MAVAPVVIVAWITAIASERVPHAAHAFVSRFVRYGVHVTAYATLLVGPWPRFSGASAGPVDVGGAPNRVQPRAGVVFRYVLALPAVVFASVLSVTLALTSVAAWFAALALGRIPAGLHELGLYCLRYCAETVAYLLLVTSDYPSLGGATGPAAE